MSMALAINTIVPPVLILKGYEIHNPLTPHIKDIIIELNIVNL